jgi:hypothetical protein
MGLGKLSVELIAAYGVQLSKVDQISNIDWLWTTMAVLFALRGHFSKYTMLYIEYMKRLVYRVI